MLVVLNVVNRGSSGWCSAMTLQTCVGLAPFPDFPGLKLKGPSTALIGWSLLLGAVFVSHLHGFIGTSRVAADRYAASTGRPARCRSLLRAFMKSFEVTISYVLSLTCDTHVLDHRSSGAVISLQYKDHNTPVYVPGFLSFV